jgi:uncharacterized protein (DUF433 family)
MAILSLRNRPYSDSKETTTGSRRSLLTVAPIEIESNREEVAIMSTQIVSTPGVLGGKPRIDGTRISVELILEMFSLGYEMKDILEEYPHLTRAIPLK